MRRNKDPHTACVIMQGQMYFTGSWSKGAPKWSVYLSRAKLYQAGVNSEGYTDDYTRMDELGIATIVKPVRLDK